MRVKAIISVLVLIGLATGCGSSSSPTTPSVISIAGNWSGTLSDNFAGTGRLAFTFAQSSAALSGTWSTTYSDPGYNNGGSLSGSVSGSSVTVTLTPSVPTYCPYNVTGTLNGSTSLSGTYAAFNCSVAVSGTFSATPGTSAPNPTPIPAASVVLSGGSSWTLCLPQFGGGQNCHFNTSIENTGAGCARNVDVVTRFYNASNFQVGSDVAMILLSATTMRPGQIVSIRSLGSVPSATIDATRTFRLFTSWTNVAC